MQTIQLQMGKSTVVRLRSKPRKVVVGNSNYFSVEFIDNDVTIQPQGVVTTNLFIYGEHHTYGLILKVNRRGTYDDRVDVKWKSHQLIKRGKQKKIKVKDIGKKLVVKDLFKIDVSTVSKNDFVKSYILDMEIKNLSEKLLNLEDLDIFATRKGVKLLPQRFVYLDENVDKGKSTRLRLFLAPKQSSGFSLNVHFKGKKIKTIVSRKYL